MVKNIKAIFISSLVIITLMLGLSFADSNGIWNYAKDLRPGTFGSDEENSSAYIFTNPLEADTINASRIDSIEIYKDSAPVATLDETGRVPLEQLPFHKGDLISPVDRLLISGLSSYDTDYFSISNLGISGTAASNVREGINFGPGNLVTGSLDNDVICTTAGGNANCGATSVMTPGIFYSMIGINSAEYTNYCTKITVGTDGSVSSTTIVTGGICEYVNSCDSTSQTSATYSDGTSCGSGKICSSGSCISPIFIYSTSFSGGHGSNCGTKYWYGVNPAAGTYDWHIKYYDHNWYNLYGSGVKAEGATSVGVYACIHQGAPVADLTLTIS